MDLRNRKVAVVGLGESGMAASLLLKEKGAIVFATDSSMSDELNSRAKNLKTKGIFVEIGRHTPSFIEDAEFVVVSPGIHDTSPAVTMAREASISIVSEIELAYWFCKSPIIAVTGTNAKSTIVTLIGLMLKASGKDAVVRGNIGDAFCGGLSNMSEESVAVLEVSSFQLTKIRDFRPRVACITNISQNHFDWHIGFDDYFGAKKNIYRNQKKDDFIYSMQMMIGCWPYRKKFLPSRTFLAYTGG